MMPELDALHARLRRLEAENANLRLLLEHVRGDYTAGDAERGVEAMADELANRQARCAVCRGAHWTRDHPAQAEQDA